MHALIGRLTTTQINNFTNLDRLTTNRSIMVKIFTNTATLVIMNSPRPTETGPGQEGLYTEASGSLTRRIAERPVMRQSVTVAGHADCR